MVVENVCSQLNREIGEFCGLVGDSVAIATGRQSRSVVNR